MKGRVASWLESRTNRAWAVAALCAVALVMRVGLIVALQAWENPNAMEHRPIALSLLQGDGFAFGDWRYYGPSSVQSPPYPLLLAGLFTLFGHDAPAAYVVALLINAVLGAASVALTYHMMLAFGARAVTALLGAALVAVWPTQVYASSHAQAIALITAASIAVIWLWYRSLGTGRFGPWLAFGVIGCVGALTEPVLLPPMALSGLLVLVWPSQLTFARRFQFAAVLLVTALVILGPWTARNYLVHGKVMPVKSTFWVNVWKGNNPYATGTDRLAITDEQIEALGGASIFERDEVARDAEFDGRRQYDMLTKDQRKQLYGKNDVEREEVFGQWAKSWIAENPGQYAKMCGVRLVKTLWIEWDNPKSQNLVYMATRTIALLLGAVGLAIALARGWRLGFAAVVVGLALLTYTLTVTAARFILPIEPVMLGLGALALMSLWQWAMVMDPADDAAAIASLPGAGADAGAGEVKA